MATFGRFIAVTLIAVPLVIGPHAFSSAAAEPATGPDVTVVVTLQDQLGSVPVRERGGPALDQQNAVLADLDGDAPTDVRHLTTANIVIATVTDAQRRTLTADPRVRAVGVDAPLQDPAVPEKSVAAAATGKSTAPAPNARVVAPAVAPPVDVPAAACTGTEAAPPARTGSAGHLARPFR